jgi:uncharacterized protein
VTSVELLLPLLHNSKALPMSKIFSERINISDVVKRGIKNWPVWEKEPSRYEWSYDCDEECYIIEGEFSIESEEGTFHYKAGDFITFKEGFRCVWDIRHDVVMHYNFK